MPLTVKGRKILRAMQREYGAMKGESVFYAAINKGIVLGAERATKSINAKGIRLKGRTP